MSATVSAVDVEQLIGLSMHEHEETRSLARLLLKIGPGLNEWMHDEIRNDVNPIMSVRAFLLLTGSMVANFADFLDDPEAARVLTTYASQAAPVAIRRIHKQQNKDTR